jgi:hypothetical protein
MVWIIIAAIAIVVVGLVALAWWSSGRSKPVAHRGHRDSSRAERNATYDAQRSRGNWSGGGGVS